MQITVRFFAAARELAGVAELEIELPEKAGVAALRKALADRAPALAPLLPHMLLAVNCQYVDEAQKIPPGAEVAVIPPVSGG